MVHEAKSSAGSLPGSALVPLLGWFTEGADTADVRKARTLLAELG
jgi:hypothetical protein